MEVDLEPLWARCTWLGGWEGARDGWGVAWVGPGLGPGPGSWGSDSAGPSHDPLATFLR